MKKLLLLVLVVVAFFYRHQIEAYFGKSKVVDLNTLNAAIPAGKEQPFSLTLKRGIYTYVFYKKEAVDAKTFVASAVDVVNIAAEHKVCPEEAYARILDLVPIDEQAAVRAVRAAAANAAKRGPAPDLADVKELESLKKTAGILAVNKQVSDAARKIARAGEFKITGTRYELAEVFENASKVSLKDSRAVRHLFCVDGLTVY